MPEKAREDVWASGDAYEPYVGRWSRLVASDFLNWLNVSSGREWLDVGCGTGALTEAILTKAAPSQVVAVDPSHGFVAHARARIKDGRALFRVGDAQSLAEEEGSFDITVSGLVLNFVPDKEKAICEMHRVTRSSGIVAAYVWDYAGKMQMMRHFWDAAVCTEPRHARPRRRGAIPHLPSRTTQRLVCRLRTHRSGHQSDRRSDPLQRLRGFLAAVSGWPSSRTRFLHVAE